ncbi:MAG: HAD family phosphatase [Candidatus Paceibacterota bacterium]
MAIKAIISDYGGVLSIEADICDFGSMYAPKFGKDADEFNKFMTEIWAKVKINETNSRFFWEKLAAFLGTDPKSLRKDFSDFFRFREDTLELIRKLKRNGYKIGLLSNHIEDLLEEIIEKRKFRQIFDVMVTSYKSGIAKPNIAIFKEIVEKLGVKPEECVYIDDLKKNIPPAEQLGMKAILFTDFETLKKKLVSFSVKTD